MSDLDHAKSFLDLTKQIDDLERDRFKIDTQLDEARTRLDIVKKGLLDAMPHYPASERYFLLSPYGQQQLVRVTKNDVTVHQVNE